MTTSLDSNDKTFDFENLGLTTGSRFNATGPLLTFLTELHALTRDHKNCYPVALNHLHFSFLAISSLIFSDLESMPIELKNLYPVVTKNLEDLEWSLADLQLKWAGHSLILVGSANYQANSARAQLAEDILSGPCAEFIKERYQGYSIPPTQWHATLLRCKNDIPDSVKALVKKVGRSIFSSIALGTPTLLAVNLDWSKTFPVGKNNL